VHLKYSLHNSVSLQFFLNNLVPCTELDSGLVPTRISGAAGSFVSNISSAASLVEVFSVMSTTNACEIKTAQTAMLIFSQSMSEVD